MSEQTTNAEPLPCAHCNGKGYLSMRNRVHRETCEYCKGRGHSPREVYRT